MVSGLCTSIIGAVARGAALLASARARWPLLGRLARPLRFGLVGLSGVAVNTAVLWALVHGGHLSIVLASVLATETAILNNFMFNDRWTFRGAGHRRPFGQRLLTFNGVALGGMAITVGLLTT